MIIILERNEKEVLNLFISLCSGLNLINRPAPWLWGPISKLSALQDYHPRMQIVSSF